MLFKGNGDPGTHPIAHDWDKILEDIEQIIAPCHGADEFDQRDQNAPSPAWDRLWITAEHLAGQSCSISTRRVVRDAAEGQNDDTEATEAAEAIIAGHNECT